MMDAREPAVLDPSRVGAAWTASRRKGSLRKDLGKVLGDRETDLSLAGCESGLSYEPLSLCGPFSPEAQCWAGVGVQRCV